MVSYIQSRTPGKLRGLKSISSDGILAVSAIDHRRVLARLFEGQSQVSSQIRSLKRSLISATEDVATAILLDPDYGVGLDNGHSGLILTLEAPGFIDHGPFTQTQLRPTWTVLKSKLVGASAIKYLIRIDTDVPDSRESALIAASAISNECVKYDIPLLLEPIITNSNGRPTAILEALELLGPLAIDLFKIQQPAEEVLHRITGAIEQPWAILSDGMSFNEFREALIRSCEAGASGFVAGRAIWGDVTKQSLGLERDKFITDIVTPRFRDLSELASKTANPIWNLAKVDDSLPANWYDHYGS